MTFSLHKFEPGFYPATGSLNNVGEGNGKFYTINVPLKSGITDENYFKIFERLFYKIIKKYQPHCIVVQCGADCLAGDPLGGFNMTPVGMGKCLRVILDEMLPTLVLGGGNVHSNFTINWGKKSLRIIGLQNCFIFRRIQHYKHSKVLGIFN